MGKDVKQPEIKKPKPGRDLLSLYPEIAAQWDYSANEGLTPSQVSPHSHLTVSWVCSKGHRWTSELGTRTRKKSSGKCPYCSQRRVWPGETDLAALYPQLVEEWDNEYNKGLTPREVSSRSHKVVGWVCSKGHKWTAEVASRTELGSDCPFCSGRKIVHGVSGLAVVRPDLVAEWDYSANGDLRPEDMFPYSAKRVNWVCAKGHRWNTSICSRVNNKTGCPYCSGRRAITGVSDLETLHPDLASEWDYERNEGQKPSETSPYSGKAVHWICKNGHRWKAVISVRVANGGVCRFCQGRWRVPGVDDVSTLYPALKNEWCEERNGPIPPTLSPDTTTHVWWNCEHGHYWRQSILMRTRNQCGCPYCKGKKYFEK